MLYLSKQLEDFVATSFLFSGHNHIVCYASCTSPVWSLRVTNQNDQVSFTLAGLAISTEIFKKISVEGRDPILNWNFTATKGAGDNCIAKVSFWKDKACDCIICTCPPGMYYDPVTGTLKKKLPN